MDSWALQKGSEIFVISFEKWMFEGIRFTQSFFSHLSLEWKGEKSKKMQNPIELLPRKGSEAFWASPGHAVSFPYAVLASVYRGQEHKKATWTSSPQAGCWWHSLDITSRLIFGGCRQRKCPVRQSMLHSKAVLQACVERGKIQEFGRDLGRA